MFAGPLPEHAATAKEVMTSLTEVLKGHKYAFEMHQKEIRLGQVFWILLNQLEDTLIRNSSWIEDSWTPGHFLDAVVKLLTKDLR